MISDCGQKQGLRTVSLVMPIRNEAAFIRASLETVLAQDYPSDLVEIIVADGMSTDGTQEIVREVAAQHPNITLIENEGKIVSTGLNAAIAHATGEVIIRVDGHCKIPPDYMRRCVKHLEDGQVDGVGGSVDTKGLTRVARVIAVAMSSRFGVGGSAFRTTQDRTMLVDTVPFAAYTQRIIERTGPYDEELVRNQDDEYNYRLRKHGGKLLLAGNIRSEYYSRSSFRSLWRQYYQYGYWKVRVLQKHPRQMSLRQIVPALFVIGSGTSVLFAALLGEPGLWLAGLFWGTYGLGNLVATAMCINRLDISLLPLLPVAFATLHISYGTGFLVGLFRFRKRWGDSADVPRTNRAGALRGTESVGAQRSGS